MHNIQIEREFNSSFEVLMAIKKRKELTFIDQKYMEMYSRQLILIWYNNKIEFKIVGSNDKYKSIDYLPLYFKKKAINLFKGKKSLN